MGRHCFQYGYVTGRERRRPIPYFKGIKNEPFARLFNGHLLFCLLTLFVSQTGSKADAIVVTDASNLRSQKYWLAMTPNGM
jgi:hypothetical protein